LLHFVIASDTHPALNICVISARRNGIDTRIYGLGNISNQWQILREELLKLNPNQMILFTDYTKVIFQRDVYELEEWMRANTRSVLMSGDTLPNGYCIAGRVRDIVDCITDPYDIDPSKYFARRYLHDMKTAKQSMIQLDNEIYFASVKEFTQSKNYLFQKNAAPSLLVYDTAYSFRLYWKYVLYTVLDTSEMRYFILDALCIRFFKFKLKYLFFYLTMSFLFLIMLKSLLF
jgi:hypothetical protein